MAGPSDATSAQTELLPQGSGSGVSFSSASSDADEGRFVPGTLLGGRYRIIALLGRGGMGEVYRATDLTLGQSVALKFLPPEAIENERMLERFHGEVRLARQVSHPNVCRVYDIGQYEGMPFISMEYVDGEDLGALLTRIGRLPAAKALETARKICAGLAAAHDRGIVHRDLKPANIMLNRRGEVVIMDFGLAAVANQLTAGDASSGTPAYMSPEQLKGAEVTEKSDIYALGLVLYELFTGKRPYEAKTVRQMLEMQEAAQLTSMTSIAVDIDPAVEKVIRRCLDPEPARRPASALAVSAALPGGDPLAAALAAGETPSPELVAAAGATEGLARRYSVPCIVLVLACIVGAMVLRQHKDAIMHAPLDLAPDALAARAREIASSLGYPRRPADRWLQLETRGPYIDYLKTLPEPRKWDEWLAAESPVAANYRESPIPMVAPPEGEVNRGVPPQTVQGMASARVDGLGRLLEFSAVPYELADNLNQPVDPETVFRAAGYDIHTFEETTPQELPAAPADQLRAWKGPHPTLPKTEVTVEIASWRGRITRVRVAPPWARPNPKPDAPSPNSLSDLYSIAVVTLVVLFAMGFARRNWKLNRGDRQGALRVAAARFAMGAVAWVGVVHAVPSDSMVDLFLRGLADWLLSAALLWLVYLAAEPAVRSRWPHSLVTWNRVLAGRWLDPQVGSHVLIGSAVGCLIWVTFTAAELWWGKKGTLDSMGGTFYLEGVRHWVAGNMYCLANGLRIGLTFFFGLFVLRTLLRRDWLAAAAGTLIGIFMEGTVINSHDWRKAVVYALVYYAIFIVLQRFGLVATISAVYFINSFNGLVLGLNWQTWYAPYGFAMAALLAAIAGAAFWRSLGRQGLIGDEPAEAG